MSYTEAHPLAQRIKAALPPHLGAQFRVCAAEEITSTNTVLKACAAQAIAENVPITPTVLLARTQSSGRGRMGRSFHSPSGTGLYMSILLVPSVAPAEALLLTTAMAAAAAEAADAIRRQYTTSTETIGIKWVNDLYLEDKKICGILAEAALTPDASSMSWAVIGIGINILPPKDGFPAELSHSAGALFPYGCPIDADDVLASLAADIVRRLQCYLDPAQVPTVLDCYRKRSVLDGRAVLVRPAGSLGGAEIPAAVLGIDDSFGLRVRYADGQETVLSSGEVVLCDDCGIPSAQTARASVHLQ